VASIRKPVESWVEDALVFAGVVVMGAAAGLLYVAASALVLALLFAPVAGAWWLLSKMLGWLP
jgi:hypothetical protein